MLSKMLCAVMLAFTLIGCAGIGFLSKVETFQGNDSFKLSSPPREDILDVVSQVGKKMGLSVSQLDRKAGVIGLSGNSSGLSTMLVGAVSRSTMTVRVSDGGRTLDISTLVSGNFGSGGQEAADSQVEEFKNQLAKQLSEK